MTIQNIKNKARVYELALNEIKTEKTVYKDLIQGCITDLEEIGQIDLDMCDEDHYIFVEDTFHDANKILLALASGEIY